MVCSLGVEAVQRNLMDGIAMSWEYDGERVMDLINASSWR